MSGANSVKEKNSPAPTESLWRKIGRISLSPMGMGGLLPSPKEQAPQETQPQEPVQEERPVDEPPPSLVRDIPEGTQVIGQEALDMYPEGSDVHNIIKNGYSLVIDPKNGSVIGMGDKFGHLLSPDEAMSKPAEQILQENGFHPTPDNVDRFLRQNDNISLPPKDLNYTGLNPESNNVVLKSPVQSVLDTVAETPVLQFLTALKSPLEIIGDGFSRYESLKASLLMGASPADVLNIKNFQKTRENALGSFSGTSKTEFPDAELRNSQMPELGDIFRKMGMPEFASAVGGITLDLLTDIGIGAASGKYLKNVLRSMKYVDKAGNESNRLLQLTEGVSRWRSKKLASQVIDAAKGIRSTDMPGSPAFNRLERALQGVRRVANFDAHMAANEVERMVQVLSKETVDETGKKVVGRNPEELYNLISGAMGDKELLKTGNGLPAELLTHVRSWSASRDRLSAQIAEQITKVIEKNPQWAADTAKQFSVKEGRQIPITLLPEIIAGNEGNYVTRAYEMFHPNWVVPKAGSELYDNALRGLIEEYDLTASEAASKLAEISQSKAIHLPERAKLARTALDVNKGSFIARQQIPSYLRDFMGEIKDPIYNMRNTVRNLADSEFKFKLFNMIDDLGLASKDFIEGSRTVQIKSGDSLAWGAIANKYVSPEMDSLLTTVKATDDVLESGYLKGLRFIKAMKTTMNPPGHIRQSMQNFGFTAGVNGVSPFNPKNWKYYFGNGGVKDILMDVWRVRSGKTPKDVKNIEKYREMMQHTLIGTELPLEDIGGYMEKLAKGVESGSLDLPAAKGSISEILGNISRGVKKIGKVSSEAWAVEDMIVKMAAYLKKTGAGMLPADAVNEIYKFTPNYAEASRLAKYVRNSPLAMTLATPFFTFKSEAHRILLNVLKEGNAEQKAWLAGTMGGRAVLNMSMLAMAGNGMKDIKEIFMSKPELITEAMLNPAAMDSGEYDINMKYIDPFNNSGIFAPLLAHAGASGINPLDYILDFTNFSPEFGYGSLIPDSVEGMITGKGKFNQQLSVKDQLLSVIQGVGPSVLTNVPKVFDETLDPNERVRRAFKLVGLDFEKRAAPWIKSSVRSRLEQKIASGEDPTATINAIKVIGFDPDVMLKSIKKKLDKGKPIVPKKKLSAKDEAVGKALANYGF